MSKATFTEQSWDKTTGRAVWRIDMARLSFPHLWRPGTYEGKPSTRLSADLIIGNELGQQLAKKMIQIANAINPKVVKPADLKNFKIAKDQEHGLVLKTSNQLDRPAIFFDSKGKPVDDPISAGAEKQLYGGCYVRAKVQVNYDADNKKVWVNLAAIQFMEDGAPLGGSSLSDEELSDGFDAVASASGFDDSDATGGALDDGGELNLDEDDFDFDSGGDGFDFDDDIAF